jgi:hypothetical protein
MKSAQIFLVVLSGLREISMSTSLELALIPSGNKTMSLKYTVKRGSKLGAVLTPHQHRDGMFVASPDRFESSQQRYATAEEACEAARINGWGVRMSSASKGPASLIRPENCDLC